LIERTADAQSSAVEDVGIDHGGIDVGMAEKFLDGADIVTGFQQMGGEGMAQGVAADGFLDASLAGGATDLLLQAGFVHVVAAEDAAARIPRQSIRRENVLPLPLERGAGVFPFQGVGKEDGAEAAGKVGVVNAADPFELFPERRDEQFGKHGDAVLGALAVADDDPMQIEIQVFDPQTVDFHQAQAAAVEQLCHEQIDPGETGEQRADLIPGKDGGQADRAFGADELKGGIQFGVDDVAEEKHECVQRLVLGGRGDPIPDGEAGEKGRDLRFGEPVGREAGVKLEEAADPMHIGFLGADGIVAGADERAKAFEQTGYRRRIGCVHIHPLGKANRGTNGNIIQ
jgi:hypothetical protein